MSFILIKEQFLALKEEIKRGKNALEMRLPNIETNVDSNIIAYIETNVTNLTRDMFATLDRVAIHIEELAKAIKEQSSRQLLSDTKNDDKRKCESVTLNLEEELSSPTLECDKMPMILEGEFQVPSLVENNELVSEEEPVLRTIQVEEQHPHMRIENVLVGVEDFNFSIDSLTFGM